jgi:hypothetical protein
MRRWTNMSGYDGVGLRGGSFTTVGLWTPTWRLDGVRWVADVAVDGSISSDRRTGRASATVTLQGRGVPPSHLRIAWNSLRPFEPALVTGRVGGRLVSVRVTAP